MTSTDNPSTNLFLYLIVLDEYEITEYATPTEKYVPLDCFVMTTDIWRNYRQLVTHSRNQKTKCIISYKVELKVIHAIQINYKQGKLFCFFTAQTVGGGNWCGRLERQSPRGGKTNILNGKKLVSCVQQGFNYSAK
jgi:hypothetical protein